MRQDGDGNWLPDCFFPDEMLKTEVLYLEHEDYDEDMVPAFRSLALFLKIDPERVSAEKIHRCIDMHASYCDLNQK